LESRLATTVSRLLIGILNSNVAVEFVVLQANETDTHTDHDVERVASSIEITTPEPKPRHVTLNPRYTFDTYVVGSGNRLAHAACQAVAEKPARAYNPLFLYGGVGLGKTHLLHAIGNACYADGLNVLYVSSEEFTNDMISAIRTHTTQAFREKYRSADVLLVDDIQFIAGKESTQEEFFHTFNTLHGQDKQIIVSSDRPPKSLVTLEERLRSRFEWGLTADIQAPDFETRLAILRSKAERTGRHISDEILESVAKQIQSNIRELEGALNRIIAFADLSGSVLTPSLVEIALADLLPSRSDLEPAHVVDLVARKFNLTAEKLLGRDRTKEVAYPRQIAMYLLREEAKISFPQIGEALGGRDHSTVMSAIDKVKDQYKNGDGRVRKDIDFLRHQLYDKSVAV
jgi:chromosomal replication initiator protein